MTSKKPKGVMNYRSIMPMFMILILEERRAESK